MADMDPVETTNLDIYGNAALPWSRPRDILAARTPRPEIHFFLGTTRPDGRPHTAGVYALWHDGDMYLVSGPETRKSRNLAQNPACTLSGALPGIDLILAGEARHVTGRPTLAAVATLCREDGWPVQVEGDGVTAPYSAPSARPPPWHPYRFTFHTAFGVAGAEPHGATRWRFER